jgi:hypothetical protein
LVLVELSPASSTDTGNDDPTGAAASGPNDRPERGEQEV